MPPDSTPNRESTPNSESALGSEREIATISRSDTPYLRRLTGTRSGPVLLVAFAFAIALPVIVIVFILLRPPELATQQGTLSFLNRGSWAVVGFAAAVGVASAGIIQVSKQLFGIRGIFQRMWITEWLTNRGAIEPLWKDWLERYTKTHSPKTESDRLPSAAELVAAQRELAVAELETALLGGRSERELQRVFDLPVEQLCAQMGAAADLAMSQPQDYAELLLALTGPARLKDIDVLAPPSVVSKRIVRKGVEDSKTYPLVAQAVRAGVDILQISLGQRWQRGVRRSAVIISGLLGLGGVLFIQVSPIARVFVVVAALVLGGFFAWLTRDLVAIVERVRR